MSKLFSGLAVIILAVIATLASCENGCYDITAAVILIPVGLGAIFAPDLTDDN